MEQCVRSTCYLQAAQEAEKRLGKIVSKEHRLYHISFAMMLGIYTSVASAGGGGSGHSSGGARLALTDFFEVRALRV